MLKTIFVTLVFTFLVASIFSSSGNLISYANAQVVVLPPATNSSGAFTSSPSSSIRSGNNPSQSGLVTSGNNRAFAQAATLPAGFACDTTQNGIVTVTKVISDPNNIASGTANTLSSTMVLTNNGFPNTFTLTGTSTQAFCIDAGHTISVSETVFPTQFTFSSPTFSSGCSSTVQAGVSVNCTVTNTITGTGTGSRVAPQSTTTIPGTANVIANPQSSPIVISSQANNTGHLKIITHNVNNCKPQSSCADVASFYPTISVNTFENNQYNEISHFPGSKVGRTVDLFMNTVPPVIQYDVSQGTYKFNFPGTNITTNASPDCEGVIHGKESKVCTITNYIYPQAGYSLGQLKIITHNVNNCKPQSSCASIVANLDPKVFVYTFYQNSYSPLANFPGSQVGRTVNFYLDRPSVPIQYDVSWDVLNRPSSKIANVTTNAIGCEGVIHPTDSKTCFIDNIVSNQMTSQNTTALSAKPTLLPSNITSASNVTSARK